MKFKVLDPVVVDANLPEAGIAKGDRGTVVEVYDQGGLEVEVVDDHGRTIGVVTLLESQVKPERGRDGSARPPRRP